MTIAVFVIAPAFIGALLAFVQRRRLVRLTRASFLALLAGTAVAFAVVGAATAFAVNPWIESTVASCQANAAMYDCDDARIVFVFPLVAAVIAIGWWVGAALFFRFVSPRLRLSRA